MVAIRDRTAYTASKSAVVGLTRSIAADYAAAGIRCNAICPGTVETEWIGKILADAPDPEATRAAMAPDSWTAGWAAPRRSLKVSPSWCTTEGDS